MSILIKGMEMPKPGAYFCELGVLDENTAVLTINTPIDESQRSYRLIPVPEHGRLIDADALGEFPYNMDFCDGGEADEWIRNAPTIIPADKEGANGN